LRWTTEGRDEARDCAEEDEDEDEDEDDDDDDEEEGGLAGFPAGTARGTGGVRLVCEARGSAGRAKGISSSSNNNNEDEDEDEDEGDSKIRTLRLKTFPTIPGSNHSVLGGIQGNHFSSKNSTIPTRILCIEEDGDGEDGEERRRGRCRTKP